MDKRREKDSKHDREEQSRRSACDRCRGQKLRCERKNAGENGRNACKRCIKARVRCITSPQRRLGRPRQQSLPRDSRVSTPTVLDFDAFLDPRGIGDVGEDFSDLCGPRAPKLCQASAPVQEAIVSDVSKHASNEVEQTEGHTISPFDTDYLFIDSPVFHEEHGGSPGDINAVHLPNAVKDGNLEKLSRLNASLFRQMSNFASGRLPDWLNISLSSTAPPTQIGELFSAPTYVRPKSPIGDILQSSQEFLNILRCFVPSKSPSSSYSPSHSSTVSSYSDFDHDDLFASAIKPETYSPRSSMDFSTSSLPSLVLSLDDCSPARPDYAGGRHHSDVPATLAILTCYVCLVRIYGTIFSQIHLLLLSRTSSLSELPAILPGLQLGGFQLDGQQHLQIGVLVEISMHLLDQIETVLGLPKSGGMGASGGGLLGDSVSSTLLNIVIRQEAVKSTDGDRAGMKSLRTIVMSIKGLLRENSTL